MQANPTFNPHDITYKWVYLDRHRLIIHNHKIDGPKHIVTLRCNICHITFSAEALNSAQATLAAAGYMSHLNCNPL